MTTSPIRLMSLACAALWRSEPRLDVLRPLDVDREPPLPARNHLRSYVCLLAAPSEHCAVIACHPGAKD